MKIRDGNLTVEAREFRGKLALLILDKVAGKSYAFSLSAHICFALGRELLGFAVAKGVSQLRMVCSNTIGA